MSNSVKIKFFLFLLCLTISVYGNDNYLSGSRFSAMSNCGIAIPDLWSVSYNQAGIAFIEKPVFGIYQEQKFLLKELSLSSVAAVFPVRYGTFGAHINYFGFSKYHELKAGLSYGKKLGKKFSAGIQLNYFSTFLQSSETNYHRINFELGLLFIPIDNLSIGFHVFNPIGEKVMQINEITIPTIVHLGIAYNIRKIITMTAESKVGSGNSIIYGYGLEYVPVNALALRLGFSSGSSNYSFGLGYKIRKLQTNIAFSNNQYLGITPGFDVSYNF